MRPLLLTFISVMFVTNVFAQDLSKMTKDEREAYLAKTAKEVAKTFCPDFYTEDCRPEISEIKVFYHNAEYGRPDLLKYNGMRYYDVTLRIDSTQIRKGYPAHASIVSVWERDGQPCAIMSPRGIGRHFYTQSYKEWIKKGVKDSDKIPYVESKGQFRDKDGNINIIFWDF